MTDGTKGVLFVLASFVAGGIWRLLEPVVGILAFMFSTCLIVGVLIWIIYKTRFDPKKYTPRVFLVQNIAVGFVLGFNLLSLWLRSA